jgi:hypothetical protein
MRYMLLIYGNPENFAKLPAEEQAGWFGEYMAFSEAIVKSGEMVAGDPLKGIETATTVRVRSGARSAAAGPFAETAEVLGGYYIVDVADLDRAMELAAQIPEVRVGSIEVRPIQEM